MADREEAPAGPSRKDKGKAKVGEPPDYDSGDDQTVQKNEPCPDSGNQEMADREEARAGPSRKDKGKAKVGKPPYYDSGDDQNVQKNEPCPDSGNQEMADREEARAGPSRKDKGKAKVGEPPYYDSGDDQNVQKNEPGPDSGDDPYSPLGPLMCFCLSKTLTPVEVRQRDPVLYLDAYEASVLLNSPEIITSPNPDPFQMTLDIFDIQNQHYRMLLTKCNRSGWTGYSLAYGWDKFVKGHNLVSGDEISFHRSRKHNILYYHYIYVITTKSDKLEVFTRFEAKDYSMSIPRGPGSRNKPETDGTVQAKYNLPPRFVPRSLPRKAMCLIVILTSEEVAGESPKLVLSSDEAFLLINRAETIANPPGRFSQDLAMTDRLDNRYHMQISNHHSGSPKQFFVNKDWAKFVYMNQLKEDDELWFFRLLDPVSKQTCYALRHFKHPGNLQSSSMSSPCPKPSPSKRNLPSPKPSSSVAPGDVAPITKDLHPVLSKTLTSQDMDPTSPKLYIDANQAYTLTDSVKLLKPMLFLSHMMLSVFDEGDRPYKMWLSYSSVNRYSISRDWGSFVRDHNLKAGDQVLFYRYPTGEGLDPYYELKYVRQKKSEMDQLLKLPFRKRKPGLGSRGTPDPERNLTKTLSARQGNTPRLCFDVNEAWILTDCDRVLEFCRSNTILMTLLVYDESNGAYDMVLTQSTHRNGEIFYTLDCGWHRFVDSHGLKAGDKVTIYMIQGETSYNLRYTRAALPTDWGASGEGPSSQKF